MQETTRLPASIPIRDMMVSWLESFCENIRSCQCVRMEGFTAFNSPRLPWVAKWALNEALELPAATPQSERRTLERLNKATLDALGSAGERQSKSIAASLNMSAARRYILHSGSSDVPSLWANRIVAIRPMLSCRTVRRRAAVGEACESPTPMPVMCKCCEFSCEVGFTFKNCSWR